MSKCDHWAFHLQITLMIQSLKTFAFLPALKKPKNGMRKVNTRFEFILLINCLMNAHFSEKNEERAFVWYKKRWGGLSADIQVLVHLIFSGQDRAKSRLRQFFNGRYQFLGPASNARVPVPRNGPISFFRNYFPILNFPVAISANICSPLGTH